MPTPRQARRRTLTALVAVPVAGAFATTVIVSTTAGAQQTDTSGVVQAEAWSAQSGARAESTRDAGGGQNVGWLTDGDWTRYDDVDLGGPGALTASIRIAAASRAGGTVELHAGSRTGELLASYPVGYTGGWQVWTTKTRLSQTGLTGRQTVFLVLKSTGGDDFVNVNWLRFTRTPTATVPGSPAPGESKGATGPHGTP